jgi:D-3-phosphoglycerate dehydrogenase
MKFKVLISNNYLQWDIATYKPVFSENNIEIIMPQVVERLNENQLLAVISDCDGVICGDDAFTKRVMDHAPKLKVIVKWGTGIDSIDKEYAQQKGIAVYNTPGAFTEPVSDLVLGLMLTVCRNIMISDQLIKSGEWPKITGYTLQEKTLGIIGVGRIGQAVARKANAFGMKIIGNDIADLPNEIIRSLQLTMMPKKELLAQADIVSLHCDLNPSSVQLIKKADFQAMKNSAWMINTARGPIIKETDLIWALENKQIAGAGLDVFEEEPLPQPHPFRTMNNVILSAHNANNSPKFWKKVHENSIKLVLKGLGIKEEMKFE